MTSHSSQGATVDRVLIHVDTSDSKSRALIDETLAYVATLHFPFTLNEHRAGSVYHYFRDG